MAAYLSQPEFWLVAVAGYLLGSIPFGLLLATGTGHGDIRNMGSGNIGATNVLRTGSKGLAALTLLLDIGKGAAAVLLAARFSPEFATIAGVAAFLGHLYPVWLRFRGGKGVATFLGILIAAAPAVGGLTAVTWFTAALLGRISSLSALTAALISPVYAWYLGYTSLAWAALVMAALIFLRHRENISRIIKGTEPRIGPDSSNRNSSTKS